MGIYYFIVNETKHVYIDEMHKLSEMSGDPDLWSEFARLMVTDWRGDEIAIIGDFDEEADNLNYKAIKVPRSEETLDELKWDLECLQRKIKEREAKENGAA